MSGPWLVMCEVDGVQEWLLRSVHLREIAGASQLLVEHDERIGEVEPSAEVLRSGGGSALLRFAEMAEAARFRVEVPGALQKHTVTATLTVSEPQDVGEASFHHAVARAASDIERKKRLGHTWGEQPSFAHALRCEGCGLEPALAEGNVPVGSVERRLGASCLARERGRTRSGWLKWMEIRDGWGGASSSWLPRDASALAGPEQLAIILADVDGVGLRLRALSTKDEFCSFSSGLDAAVRGAVVEAVYQEVAPPREARTTLPVEVLYAGGDDVLLACRGKLALPLALRLVAEFCVRASGGDGHWCGEAPLGMSAGIAIVNPKFPFRVAHRIAAMLLRNAKQAARDQSWPEGAVDWAVITEPWADGDQIFADRLIERSTDALHLTGRPYRASSEEAQRSLGSLRAACRHLALGFPRNKLFDLRGLNSAGALRAAGASHVVDARRILSSGIDTILARARRDPDVENCWRDGCRALGIDPKKPFWGLKNECRTPVGDLAESVELWGGK